jgi:hypothetical protein
MDRDESAADAVPGPETRPTPRAATAARLVTSRPTRPVVTCLWVPFPEWTTEG